MKSFAVVEDLWNHEIVHNGSDPRTKQQKCNLKENNFPNEINYSNEVDAKIARVAGRSSKVKNTEGPNTVGDTPTVAKDQNSSEYFSEDQITETVPHVENNSFQCSLCMESFSVAEDLWHHEIVHNDFEPRPKRQKFNTRQRNVPGILRRGEKKHLCSQCDLHFCSKEDLKTHEKSHISKDFQNMFSCIRCSMCDKKFKSSSSYDKHIGIPHHFTCSLCDKKFVYLATLRDHEKSHKSVKVLEELELKQSRSVHKKNESIQPQILVSEINGPTTDEDNDLDYEEYYYKLYKDSTCDKDSI